MIEIIVSSIGAYGARGASFVHRSPRLPRRVGTGLPALAVPRPPSRSGRPQPAPLAVAALRAKLDESSGREVAVEGERVEDAERTHEREACRVHGGVLTLVVATQPLER